MQLKPRVAPFTGAWIEIANVVYRYDITARVAPFTGAWIEIFLPPTLISWYDVAPFTGAWIEIHVIALICLTLH